MECADLDKYKGKKRENK